MEVAQLARTTSDETAAALLRQVTRLVQVMPARRLIAILDRYTTKLESLVTSLNTGRVVIRQRVHRGRARGAAVSTTEWIP